MTNNMNRETYLNIMIDKALPLFDNAGFNMSEIRDRLKVSCSFIKGTRGSANNAIGVHYNTTCSKNGNHEMMIEPSVDNSLTAISVLIHEMVHSIQTHLYHDSKGFLNVRPHGKEFAKIAKCVGLEGKMTATIPGERLKETINGWIKEVGEYPHSSLNLSKVKKQTTRNLKVQCSAMHCNNHFRASRLKILSYQTNICIACGGSTMFCKDEPSMITAYVDNDGMIEYK